MAIIGILAFAVALLVSVMIHEAGHYLTAKKFGMKVTEFFVGFGKKIWSVTKGETEFGLKAIPAGGYCKIVGMTPREELSPADADRAFIKASVPQRLIVLGAGSFLHFVIGFVLLIVLFASVGITSLTNQVERVSECIPQTANEVCSAKSVPSPAKNAGIIAGDKIVKVNGLSYQEWSEVVEVIRSSAGKQLDITIDRNGSLINILVTPASRELDGKEIGVLGVVNQVGTITYGPLTAIAKGGSFTIDILQNSVTALISLPSKIPDLVNQTFGNQERDPEGLVGVVGVARASGETAETKVLTTSKYLNLFKNCPYVDDCLEDERLPRYNVFYLLRLKKSINSLNFNKNC